MSRPGLPDPLETALTWLWALGTAAGLTMLGLIAHGEYSAEDAFTTVPALSTGDTPADDAL